MTSVNHSLVQCLDAKGPLDAWEWIGKQEAIADFDHSKNSFVRSVPLLEQAVFGESHSMTTASQTLLANMKMRHGPTGEERFVHRGFFCRWYGLEGTPYSSFLEGTPCIPWIVGATGTAASPGAGVGEACGLRRYCVHCEQVYKEFENFYHVPMVVHAMTAILRKALTSWSGRDSGPPSWGCTFSSKMPDHECGPQCPSNPTVGR